MNGHERTPQVHEICFTLACIRLSSTDIIIVKDIVILPINLVIIEFYTIARHGYVLNGAAEPQVDMLDIPGKGRCCVFIARFSYDPPE